MKRTVCLIGALILLLFTTGLPGWAAQRDFFTLARQVEERTADGLIDGEFLTRATSQATGWPELNPSVLTLLEEGLAQYLEVEKKLAEQMERKAAFDEEEAVWQEEETMIREALAEAKRTEQDAHAQERLAQLERDESLNQAQAELDRLIQEAEAIRNQRDTQYPFFDFMIERRLARNEYFCIDASGYRFILQTGRGFQPRIIDNRGYLATRLQHTDIKMVEAANQELFWFDVYIEAPERGLNEYERMFQANETAQENAQSSLASLRQEWHSTLADKARMRAEASSAHEEVLQVLKQWEKAHDLRTSERNELMTDIGLLTETLHTRLDAWWRGMCAAGYDLFLDEYLGDQGRALLVDEALDRTTVQYRFGLLAELIFTPVFTDPVPSDYQVTLSFQDPLPDEIRDLFVHWREVMTDTSAASDFILEKFVFNKWQEELTLSLPLAGRSVPVKYVPGRILDEYRVSSPKIPGMIRHIAYERPAVGELPILSPPPDDPEREETAPLPLDQEDVVPGTTLPGSLVAPPTAGLGEPFEVRFEISRPLPHGTVEIAFEESSLDPVKLPLSQRQGSVTLRVYSPGQSTGTLRVIHQGHTAFEGTFTVQINRLGPLALYPAPTGGFYTEALTDLSPLLAFLTQAGTPFPESYELFDIPFTTIFQDQLTYTGALLMARTLAHTTSLEAGYDEFLNPQQTGLRLPRLEDNLTTPVPSWREGLFDWRGNPAIDVRLRMLENRPRRTTELLQVYVVSTEGSTLTPINDTIPGTASLHLLLPPEKTRDVQWEIEHQ